MSANKQTTPDDEIDLREIILTLWKEKFLILIITLVFTVAGYIYGSPQPKVYQSTITLRDAPMSSFIKYELYFSSQLQQQISLASNFNKEFKINLIILDNLVMFVEQNKKIDKLKSYLKTNNIEIRNYFQGKFQPVTDKKNNNANQYSLNFSSLLQGAEFLNDYIIFIKQLTTYKFKEELKQRIKDEIEIYNLNLKIAETINLENPILRSFAEGNSVVNEPSALFYRGSKVLVQQKLHLEKILKETDDYTFNYNPILEQSSKLILGDKSINYFMGIAFALGLFFSFIVILIRSAFIR